jgi:hypothetical protein
MWEAVIGGLLGAGQMAYGIAQKNKAQKMTSAQPMLEIPDIYNANVGSMEQEAQTGYSPDTLKYLSDTLGQNLSQSTSAILQGGGSINSIANLYNQNAQQMRAIGAENDKLRTSKLTQLMETRKDLAGMQLKQWQMNVLDQWKNKQTASAMIAQQGNQLISQGLNTGLSALGQGLQYAGQKQIPSSQMNKEVQNLYGNTNQSFMYNPNPNPISPDLPTLAQTQSQIQLDANTMPNKFAYSTPFQF